MFVLFDNSFNAADFPAPRPPQMRTLPFRRRVFSALSSNLSIETIFRDEMEGTVRPGDGSGTSFPRLMV